MWNISPTRQEISLASRLVRTLFHAICEVYEAALHDTGPPVEPTLESVFSYIEPAFRDHISAAYSKAAQQRIPIFGIWECSCHQTVIAVSNQIKDILLPDREAFNVLFREAELDEITAEVERERYRKYFEASISCDAIEKIRASWHESKEKLALLGEFDSDEFEFALQMESAHADRHARDAAFQQELKESGIPKNAGPVAPDGFRWGGSLFSGLKGKAWLLTAHLWTRPEKTSDDGAVVGRIWDDLIEVNSDSIGSARRQANSFFRKNSIPWSIVTRKNPENRGWQLITLCNKPPK